MKRAVASLLLLACAVPARAGELRNGGKLLLTNGISSIEGSAGGGLSSWAVIAGNATRDGLGASAHATYITLPDFEWRSFGTAVGLFDRLELSYARQSFDTGAFGASLGLGRGFTFNQDVFGAKLRLFGSAIYGSPYLPQVSIGMQRKHASDGAIARAVGARHTADTDFYVAATKLFLSRSVIANATVRLTRANQAGLLGYGGDRGDARELEFEGTLAYQFSRKFVLGGEYRTKPDKLGFAPESDWLDIFAAYAIARNLTATAAYVDLGSIATSKPQRGLFVQIQASF